MSETTTIDFLVRAAREFRCGGWAFTGFHWPVLAGQLAHSLPGLPFSQIFEAGMSTHAAGRRVPTSTTDYAAFENAFGYLSDTASVLLSNARHFDRVVLDASNVDILGCINSSFIGDDRLHPKVRLPGGGGAPDIASAASTLVLLSGATDLNRFQARVEHVTASPGPHTTTRLHTRWGIVRLGRMPLIEEIADVRGSEEFVRHAQKLGADTSVMVDRDRVTEVEREAAEKVISAAADRGYHVASRALTEIRRKK